MEHVVANGDERWRAWIKEEGWDPCPCCDLQGYHLDGDSYESCEPCAGFGFMIPGERWVFDVEES